jgi:hypothetical protein
LSQQAIASLESESRPHVSNKDSCLFNLEQINVQSKKEGQLKKRQEKENQKETAFSLRHSSQGS